MFFDVQTEQWIHDFARFANNLNPTAAFPHKRITNSFYWSWNGNNYPQLGLVNNVRPLPSATLASIRSSNIWKKVKTSALCTDRVISSKDDQINETLQDPGAVEWNYTGDLQPGWLEIQWLKINNLTSTLTGNPVYSPEAAVASGGGFGLR